MILNEPVAVCGVGEQESVAVTLGVLIPVPVGVPESKPPLESVNPAGNPVAPHVTAPVPPVLANWKL